MTDPKAAIRAMKICVLSVNLWAPSEAKAPLDARACLCSLLASDRLDQLWDWLLVWAGREVGLLPRMVERLAWAYGLLTLLLLVVFGLASVAAARSPSGMSCGLGPKKTWLSGCQQSPPEARPQLSSRR